VGKALGIAYFSWVNKALVKGGEDCGHCLSLATSHKCGWCSTIEVCTTLSQCKSNPFNSTTHQVSIHDCFHLFIMRGKFITLKLIWFGGGYLVHLEWIFLC
jgi:hypothetical protein